MEIIYQPYIDPEFECLIERIYPPWVCIDNGSYKDCTLVKVDSANKHGILLEMVRVLTDLDLVISKSYISSDGGWFMDVFHVTDQLGNKITDESLILYIFSRHCVCLRRECNTGTEGLGLRDDQQGPTGTHDRCFRTGYKSKHGGAGDKRDWRLRYCGSQITKVGS